MKPQSHAKTDAQAASMLGIELITFRKWKATPDFPVRRVAAGWPMAALHNYAITRKQRDKRNLSGEHSDRKGRKLDVEIEILELKRDEIRRELIPMQEHLAAVGEIASILRWGAEQFPAMAATETKDARLTGIAETVRDRVLARVAEKLEAAGAAEG
jgi:hypothetical protein